MCAAAADTVFLRCYRSEATIKTVEADDSISNRRRILSLFTKM